MFKNGSFVLYEVSSWYLSVTMICCIARLKLITRGVDEDVAILPDDELLFKVKPKVDPLGALNPQDYSTSLRVSANGVSVCVPDQNQTKASYTNAVKEQLGVAPEREVYFWVYTDFYKWSLLTQVGLATIVHMHLLF